MYFHKETIMGQVLFQVNEDKNNQFYISQIDELVEDINSRLYDEVDIQPWSKNGLIITNRNIDDDVDKHKSWIFFETEYVTEYSWLIHELNDIYKPKIENTFRLNTTLGYMLKIYDEKYNDISDVMRMVAIVSIVFLHPDHIGHDRFVVHPINLPQFGDDF